MADITHAPDPIDVAAGLRVRTLRKAAAMSQQQIGKACGVTFQQIQKYERGTNRMSVSAVVRIARGLNTSPLALFPGELEAASAPAGALRALTCTRGAEEMLTAYAAVGSSRQRRAILNMARACVGGSDEIEDDLPARAFANGVAQQRSVQ